MHPDPRKIAPIVLLVVVAIGSIYYLSTTSTAAAETALAASGTVEAVEITVAAEIGGRVVEVLAEEGDAVAAGEPLVRLDDTALQAQLDQARAALTVAEANYDLVAAGAPAPLPAAGPATPTPEQLAVASAQVDAAAAAVAVVEVQLGKTVIAAPIDGVVLERLIEPGEIALPNAPLLLVADLGSLTLTVYAPEDRYGEIFLGQEVAVTVDSFPGETFSGVVVHIADRAEFTPRNVQTQEGRRTTVFAVRLALGGSDGRLKPGMPADVVFEAP